MQLSTYLYIYVSIYLKYAFLQKRYLRNVSVAQGDGKPDVAFSSDGTLKSVELKIMNLRPDGRSNQDLIWEEVRT